jgi:hypothetical protein
MLLSARGVADERFVERFEQARARGLGLQPAQRERISSAPKTGRRRRLWAAHSRLVQAWTPVITAWSGDTATARSTMAGGLSQDTDALIDELNRPRPLK